MSGSPSTASRASGNATHLALCAWHGVQGVFRIRADQASDGRSGQAGSLRKGKKSKTRGASLEKIPSGRGAVKATILKDHEMQRPLPTSCPKWLDLLLFSAIVACLGLGQSVRVREVAYRVEGPHGYRWSVIDLHTTLLDQQAYAAEELAALYLRRWSIEVHFRDLKTTMRAAVLKGQTPDVVLKEIWSYVTAYNLVRAAVVEAAGVLEVDIGRVSLIDAWRWLQQITEPRREALMGGGIDSMLGNLLINPINPRHQEPRAKKRSGTNHVSLAAPRREYFAQPPIGQQLAA